MTQPPAGGYPPPDPSQPGGYPPPAQPGPPAGGYPPPGPPPVYTPPPAPPGGGYQPPPAPGYGPPPTGGYQPPPPPGGAPGGYPPPAPGYQPPPGQGYGAAPGGYAPGPNPGTPSLDLSKVTTGDYVVIGLGVLLLIFSFFGWVSSSGGGISESVGGWHNWWFLIIIIELAITVIYALTTLGIMKPGPIKPSFLFYGAALGFVLYIIALIQIFASYTASTSATDVCAGLTGTSLAACNSAAASYGNYSVGPGFGIWASLVLGAAFAYFIALWAQKSDRLPFKVPGPAL